MRPIIGLAAPARSGKDTVANMLLAHPEVAAFALADPLKLGCQALFGLSGQQTWDDSLKEQTIPLWGRSPREFFQQVGTEWMRHHNPSHWLERAEREINPRHQDADVCAQDLSHPDAPFRLAAQAFFDFAPSQVWDPTKAEVEDADWRIPPSAAVAMLKSQALTLDPDYMEKRSLSPVEPLNPRSHLPREAKVIIIKDIRFENEADYLRRHKGVICHITRSDSPKVNSHSSELGVLFKPGDYKILNNGSLSELNEAVAKFWTQVTNTFSIEDGGK